MSVSNPSDVDAVVNRAKEDTKEGASDESTEIKITLWQNGFQVDGGEFRDYEAPENQQFMKELKEGYVPRELREKYGAKGTNVGLEDKRQEQYEPPPPPKYTAYAGEATSMGGSTGVGLTVDKSTGKPVVDEGKPKTRVRIRFHNGEQEVVDFNTDHTVGDIHSYVMMAAPVDG